MLLESISGARGRGRTGTSQRKQDFKSCVSTNFTTRANDLDRERRVVYPPAGLCSIADRKRLQFNFIDRLRQGIFDYFVAHKYSRFPYIAAAVDNRGVSLHT
jgi:hypothetical protein